jgi:hypothetical protein
LQQAAGRGDAKHVLNLPKNGRACRVRTR